MKLRRARRHHDAVEILLLYVFDDLLLGGVGTGEHGRAGHNYAGFVLDGRHYLIHRHIV